jgi:hypothetical protein
MNTQCEHLCNQLAQCIVERDFGRAQTLLAPWLHESHSSASLQQMVDALSEGLAHPPHRWTVDEGMAGLDDLRKPDGYGPPSHALSEEITAENFRGWLSIQLVPAPSVHEEQNVCYDLWLAVVEHHGAMLAGYLEAAEAA